MVSRHGGGAELALGELLRDTGCFGCQYGSFRWLLLLWGTGTAQAIAGSLCSIAPSSVCMRAGSFRGVTKAFVASLCASFDFFVKVVFGRKIPP